MAYWDATSLPGVSDWPRIRARYEAWWQGELPGPLVRVTAPCGSDAPDPDPAPTDEAGLLEWFTDPARVLPRLERDLARTYYAGDAFPVLFPLSTGLPAIESAYLGASYRIVPGANTGWSSPLIEDWGRCPPLTVDPANSWWRRTQRLLETGAARGAGRWVAGIPDLQGGGHIVAELRGAERLALDLYDHPEAVKRAIAEVNEAWWFYYRACFEIIHRYQAGYVDWLSIWSDRPAVTVECDFSGMISPAMFNEFFLPALQQQTEWVGRTLYHLDGPQALPHLDSLLALPTLSGIQWVPLPGQRASDWVSLYQYVQKAGKRLVLACAPWEVRLLLDELRPEGLLLTTSCASPAEAEALVAEVMRNA